MLEKCDAEQLRMVLNTYSVQRKSILSVKLETYSVDGVLSNICHVTLNMSIMCT